MSNRIIISVSAFAVALTLSSNCGAGLEWATATEKLPYYQQMHGMNALTVNGSSYLYTMGGNSTNYPQKQIKDDINAIFFSKIGADGQPGAWQVSSVVLNEPSTAFSLNAYIERATFSAGGKIFIVGGDTNGSISGTNRYQTITVNENGEPTACTEYAITGSYTYAYSDSVAFDSVNNRVYAMKRADGSVHVASVSNGTIGEFSMASVSGAANRAIAPAVVKNGYLYWFGGQNSAVYKSTNIFTLGSDGMPTDVNTATAMFPNNLYDSVAFNYRGEMYVGGGCISGNADAQKAVYRAVFGDNGDITKWEKDSDLVKNARRIPCCVLGDYIYISGGRYNSTLYDVVQVGKAHQVAPVTETIPDGQETAVSCELPEGRNVALQLTPTTGGTLKVDYRSGSDFVAAAAFKNPDDLYKESLVLTNTEMSGFSASLAWQVDTTLLPAKEINTLFRVSNGEIVETFPVTKQGNVYAATGITGFSEWYLGNSAAVPVSLSGFELE